MACISMLAQRLSSTVFPSDQNLVVYWAQILKLCFLKGSFYIKSVPIAALFQETALLVVILMLHKQREREAECIQSLGEKIPKKDISCFSAAFKIDLMWPLANPFFLPVESAVPAASPVLSDFLGINAMVYVNGYCLPPKKGLRIRKSWSLNFRGKHSLKIHCRAPSHKTIARTGVVAVEVQTWGVCTIISTAEHDGMAAHMQSAPSDEQNTRDKQCHARWAARHNPPHIPSRTSPKEPNVSPGFSPTESKSSSASTREIPMSRKTAKTPQEETTNGGPLFPDNQSHEATGREKGMEEAHDDAALRGGFGRHWKGLHCVE
ncbi:hypothetical protein B0H10DRAFT_1964691 [Mycena sp. CBHHK59/15]|nr:hypothetical protein B0H10DRAFT_1964691 [Mycena sp. CBHHK59/15]